MFLGNLWFSPDQRDLVVPRPGSGDVLVLSAEDLTISARFRTRGQPLEAALDPDGHLLARAWQTGKLLTGKHART